jgi:hypothetical protein
MQTNLSSIKARRAFIARQLNQLQSEDDELATVEEILARLAKAPRSTPGKRRGRPPAQKAVGKSKVKAKAKKGAGRGKRNGAGLSQRELVLAALKKPGAGWMDVRQIIAWVKENHGVAMPPRSISPLLSNLKKSGAIVRTGRRVALPERAKARS